MALRLGEGRRYHARWLSSEGAPRDLAADSAADSAAGILTGRATQRCVRGRLCGASARSRHAERREGKCGRQLG